MVFLKMNIWRIAHKRKLIGFLSQAFLRPSNSTWFQNNLLPLHSFRGFIPPRSSSFKISVPLGCIGLALVDCSSDVNKVGKSKFSLILQDSFSQSKLFKAIQRENVREVEKLIRLKHVDVNARHDLGWSPLHLASVNGRQEVDKELPSLFPKLFTF